LAFLVFWCEPAMLVALSRIWLESLRPTGAGIVFGEGEVRSGMSPVTGELARIVVPNVADEIVLICMGRA